MTAGVRPGTMHRGRGAECLRMECRRDEYRSPARRRPDWPSRCQDRRIIGNASTNLEHLHIGARAVLQTMPVAIASLKAGGIAAAQEFLAGICHESNFAGQHVDEFVGLGMPMALAGPCAGRQCQQIDAELGQPGSVTELAAMSRSTWNVER
jgi:hypothetical protein